MLISFSSNKFQRDLSGCTGRERGGRSTPGFSWWGCAIQIVTFFGTKKFHFSHPFSDLASRKLCHHFLDSTPTKEILICIFMSLSFLYIWN